MSIIQSNVIKHKETGIRKKIDPQVSKILDLSDSDFKITLKTNQAFKVIFKN